MKPFHIYLLIITLSLILAAGSYFAGKHVEKEDCPPSIKIDTVINFDQPEIERLKKQCFLLKLDSQYLAKKYDSIQFLLNKKNETKIITLDTVVPAINRQWAKYHTH